MSTYERMKTPITASAVVSESRARRQNAYTKETAMAATAAAARRSTRSHPRRGLKRARASLRVRFPRLALDRHPDVYPPSEDTAFLADCLPELTGVVVDVGTGSGVLALGLAAAGCRVVATDVNPHAVRLARR